MRKILIAAAAMMLTAGASLFGASAADKLKVGFIYLGPVGDFGWTYQHELARQALVKEFGDKIETTYLENVSEGPDAERSIEQLVRAGNKLIFTTSFGYMEPTLKVAKKYPNDPLRTRHRLQARREHVDLFRPVLRRPLHPGHHRRQDVESRRTIGYIGSFPIPEVIIRHQRHDPGRSDHQSEHQGQDHLGELVVRSGQGSRFSQGADSIRVRT